MSDDRDGQALHRIERDLLDDDPAFVARMRRQQMPARPSPTVPVVIGLVYVVAPMTMLLFGWTGALTALGLGVLIVAAVLVRRR